MSLTRTPHWATRELDAHFTAHRTTPFQWGVFDCCLMPALAIQAMTGVMIADDFYPGKYHDKASAFALIKSVTGGTTVADAAAHCAQKHGLTEYPKPLFASRGDLVVVDNAGQMIAGLVHLSGHVACVTEKGWLRLPITAVQRAWKV